MNLLKRCLIALLFLVVLLMIIGMFLPSKFDVQRSVTIDKRASEIYPFIVDLKRWKDWGVWFERDPNMVVTYSGPSNGLGMKSSWVSAQEGSGEMTITALSKNQSVTYDLYFPDFDMGSTGQLILTESGGSTTVTWQDAGDVGSNPVNRYFAMMMDSLIGPDFEKGLKNLKLLTEQPSS